MRKILFIIPFFLWTCGGGGSSPTESESEVSVPLPTAQDIIIPLKFHIFHYRTDGLDSLSVDVIQDRFLNLNLNFKGLNSSINEIPKEANPSNAPYEPGVDYSFFDDVGQHNVQFVGVSGAVYPEDLIIGVDIVWHRVDEIFQQPSHVSSYLISNFDTEGILNVVSADFPGMAGQAFGQNVAIVSYGQIRQDISGDNLLTHEVGHLFGYSHTFDYCENRGWSDIPKQSSPNTINQNIGVYKHNGRYYASGALNTCGEPDQFMNYMDYTWHQGRMFSKGQVVEGMQFIQNYNWNTVSLKLN